MKNKKEILQDIKGLNNEEVIESRNKYGPNKLSETKKESFILKIINIFKEPMFLLLIIAASVYFIANEYSDGIIMLLFVFGICFIEYIQESRTDKALEELNKLSSLNVKVIRNGLEDVITSEDIVVGDIVLLEEGDKVPADGIILYSQSLGVNESALTGESAIVYKSNKEDNDNQFKNNICYSGTNITNGFGIIKVINVGKNTEIGRIGESLRELKKEKSPLELQINKLVLICTIISSVIFILTIILNYINYSSLDFSDRILESILSGITIAMATIPEEIPVILTVFLAMGAWDLTKDKTITRNTRSIETLGAVNVLCTDKTGTLTENKMKVQDIYEYYDTFKEMAYLSCPKVAYDPMDIAIKEYFNLIDNDKYQNITKEYAFTPDTKMTGQIWDNNLLCVKGAYESVLPLCNLSENNVNTIKEKIDNYSSNGYRVIAVASQDNLVEFPETLIESKLNFMGLIALYDPPRYMVKESIKECNDAGIRVIMITGDNGETAKGIAKKIGLNNYDRVVTGTELENISDDELFEVVKNVNIFARVYPNHKMRIVNALQKDNKVVAMTGDGVNDAPALKKANVGIAMGKRGTNVAKESADLILLDDNLSTIVKAIKNGRNIYKNIKKAISYIITIHIPIALLSLFVPLFKLPSLLLPLHVMLLELIIDPTSSIVFQRIKASNEIMKENPRNIRESIINLKTALISISKGLLIFLVVFLTYFYRINKGYNVNQTISIAYSVLVLSIVLVTYQISGSELTIKSFIKSFKDKISLLINFGVFIGLLLLVYVPFFNRNASTAPIGIKSWIIIFVLVLLAVVPFDIFKIIKRRK